MKRPYSYYLWLIPAIAFAALAGIAFCNLNPFNFALGTIAILGSICCLWALKEQKKIKQ